MNRKKSVRDLKHITPALRSMAVPVEGLQFNPRNCRRHSRRSQAALRADLAEFGQQKPIVVSQDGVVIAGNGTLQAAKDLGWKFIAAITTDLHGARKLAYAIADNRTGDLSEFDPAVAEDLRELLDGTPPLAAAAGFSNEDLADLFGEQGEAEKIEEFIPPPCPPMKWILLGMPANEFSKVYDQVEALRSLASIQLEVTRDDDAHAKRQ